MELEVVDRVRALGVDEEDGCRPAGAVGCAPRAAADRPLGRGESTLWSTRSVAYYAPLPNSIYK